MLADQKGGGTVRAMRRSVHTLWFSSLLAASALILVGSACGEPTKPNKSADGLGAVKTIAPKSAPKRVAVHGEGGGANAGAAHGAPVGNPHGAGGGRVIPTPAPEPSEAREIEPSAETTAITVEGLTFSIPSQWERQPPANRMRIDQYDVPGPGGGASLGVFRFPGGGGSAQANIDRWVGQFDQLDGRASKDVAEVSSKTVGSLTITTVSISGTYQGTMGMRGGQSAQAKTDAQLLAFIVEGSGNPFFFKLSGPKTTVGLWTKQWSAMGDSFAMDAAAPNKEVAPAEGAAGQGAEK